MPRFYRNKRRLLSQGKRRTKRFKYGGVKARSKSARGYASSLVSKSGRTRRYYGGGKAIRALSLRVSRLAKNSGAEWKLVTLLGATFSNVNKQARYFSNNTYGGISTCCLPAEGTEHYQRVGRRWVARKFKWFFQLGTVPGNYGVMAGVQDSFSAQCNNEQFGSAFTYLVKQRAPLYIVLGFIDYDTLTSEYGGSITSVMDNYYLRNQALTWETDPDFQHRKQLKIIKVKRFNVPIAEQAKSWVFTYNCRRHYSLGQSTEATLDHLTKGWVPFYCIRTSMFYNPAEFNDVIHEESSMYFQDA